MYINPETAETSESPVVGYQRVADKPQPLTGRLEKAVHGNPELVAGTWQGTWLLQPLTATEEAQVVEAERVNAGAARVEALKRNNFAYESAINTLTAGYPQSEIATWERQRAEALAWNADPAALTPWIDTAATARGITRTDYLSRTYTKAVQFAQASAHLTGLRQRYEREITEAANPASVLAAYSFEI